MRLALSILLLSGLAAFGASEVLPSANDFRASVWTNAGVPGGIPYRTTIATTLSSGATSGDIESALSSAASNTVVFLNAGTYNLSGDIKFSYTGKTLRGATNSFGQPTTILNFGGSASGWGLVDMSSAGYPANDWASVSSVNINSGLTKGSISITVASAPTSFTVGQVFFIDALEDGTHVNPSGSDQGAGVYQRTGPRPLMQMCRATNVSGTTIKFEPPLLTDYFADAGIDPEMYWYDDNYSETVRWSGVEDLVIRQNVAGGSSHNIAIGPAYACWARNVWTTNVPNNGSGFNLKFTLNCEVSDCFGSVHDNTGSGTYMYDAGFATACKFANNIAVQIPCAVALRAASGCVVFGNYATNFPYAPLESFMTETMMFHGSHIFACIFEANYTPKIIADYIHGNASYNTIHRNRLTGWETGKTSGTSALAMEAQQDNFAFIGNVLGTDSYHGSYAAIVDFDADSSATMTSLGNYNTFDDAIHSGESLGTDTNAYSYVYSAAPTWWGDRGWPWVKSSSVSDSLNTIQATNQPAGFRFLMGSNVPSASQSGGSAVINTSTLSGGAKGLNISGNVTIR